MTVTIELALTLCRVALISIPGQNATAQTSNLTPRTDFDSPFIEVDIEGLQIGVAEYQEGPTGCTVFLFTQGAVTAVDMRGGMVGQVEADYEYQCNLLRRGFAAWAGGG